METTCSSLQHHSVFRGSPKAQQQHNMACRKSPEKKPVLGKSEYQLMIKHLFECNQQEYEHYRKHPLSHPKYHSEWLHFMSLRTKSVKELGGNPAAYDFYSEWKNLWPKRLQKLEVEEWEKKKKESIELSTNHLKSRQILQDFTKESCVSSPKNDEKLCEGSTGKHSRSESPINMHVRSPGGRGRRKSRSPKRSNSPQLRLESPLKRKRIDSSLFRKRLKKTRMSRSPPRHKSRSSVSPFRHDSRGLTRKRQRSPVLTPHKRSKSLGRSRSKSPVKMSKIPSSSRSERQLRKILESPVRGHGPSNSFLREARSRKRDRMIAGTDRSRSSSWTSDDSSTSSESSHDFYSSSDSHSRTCTCRMCRHSSRSEYSSSSKCRSKHKNKAYHREKPDYHASFHVKGNCECGQAYPCRHNKHSLRKYTDSQSHVCKINFEEKNLLSKRKSEKCSRIESKLRCRFKEHNFFSKSIEPSSKINSPNVDVILDKGKANSLTNIKSKSCKSSSEKLDLEGLDNIDEILDSLLKQPLLLPKSYKGFTKEDILSLNVKELRKLLLGIAVEQKMNKPENIGSESSECILPVHQNPLPSENLHKSLHSKNTNDSASELVNDKEKTLQKFLGQFAYNNEIVKKLGKGKHEITPSKTNVHNSSLNHASSHDSSIDERKSISEKGESLVKLNNKGKTEREKSSKTKKHKEKRAKKKSKKKHKHKRKVYEGEHSEKKDKKRKEKRKLSKQRETERELSDFGNTIRDLEVNNTKSDHDRLSCISENDNQDKSLTNRSERTSRVSQESSTQTVETSISSSENSTKDTHRGSLQDSPVSSGSDIQKISPPRKDIMCITLSDSDDSFDAIRIPDDSSSSSTDIVRLHESRSNSLDLSSRHNSRSTSSDFVSLRKSNSASPDVVRIQDDSDSSPNITDTGIHKSGLVIEDVSDDDFVVEFESRYKSGLVIEDVDKSHDVSGLVIDVDKSHDISDLVIEIGSDEDSTVMSELQEMGEDIEFVYSDKEEDIESVHSNKEDSSEETDVSDSGLNKELIPTKRKNSNAETGKSFENSDLDSTSENEEEGTEEESDQVDVDNFLQIFNNLDEQLQSIISLCESDGSSDSESSEHCDFLRDQDLNADSCRVGSPALRSDCDLTNYNSLEINNASILNALCLLHKISDSIGSLKEHISVLYNAARELATQDSDLQCLISPHTKSLLREIYRHLDSLVSSGNVRIVKLTIYKEVMKSIKNLF